jgi:hypothetical protein
MQLLIKFKNPLIKPKPQKFNFINFLFEFHSIHISYLAQLEMINIILKFQNKNIH